MKKAILKLSVIMLLIVLMLLIPNTVNAETIYEFDYSQIKALEQEFPKLYELDENIGEIVNQEWTDENGIAITGSNLEVFEMGKIYKYTAEIRLNEPDAFIEIINPPPALEGGSYSVSRLGVDTIGIEIVTAIPKEYKLTLNITDGITIDGVTSNISKEFVVYEMDEFVLDFELEDGYEIVSATANGNAIFNNDAYFDDTFAHIFENKLKVWNINTDIEIFINAEKIKPVLNVDLSVNELFEGDSIKDVEFKFDCADFVVKEMQFAVEKEDGLEEFIGTFEADKKYLVAVFFDVNNLDALDEQYSYVIIKHNNQELEVDIDNNGFYVICELDIKEKTTTDIEEKPIINSGEKDNSPKTGVNFSVIYVILGMATLGVIATSKRK